MPSSKKPHHNSTRHRSSRALSKSTDTAGKPEAADSTASHSSAAGIHKPEGKTRATAARRRKKLQNALVKRVDARDSQEALTEQAELLGVSTLQPSPSPTEVRPPRSRARARRQAKADKKYMDDILNEEDILGDELQRAKRWVPDFEHRARPVYQPPGVPYGLWMSYKHLDEYIYRHSLSPAEVQALPLLDDVHEYQNSDGRAPKPTTPPGYQFDENLELVPILKEGSS
ncbi:hypothetical protein F4859DRAFT_513553 [Xylaria cf. heliscus]|nr:hypothetical protein F4859DRAFT_513553 [Xylaria cf. heliscus]